MSPARALTREKATEYVTALLQRICGGGPHAQCVTPVYVFGSYARGAKILGDVDVSISLDPRLNPAVKFDTTERIIHGRDGYAPFRKALRPNTSVQIFFDDQRFPGALLIYERGDTLEQALERVHAIKIDPLAGRAERDPRHPSLEAVADALDRPSRIMLTELAGHGYIGIDLLELPDADLDVIANASFRQIVKDRWKPNSPLARGVRAAEAYLQARRTDLAEIRVLGEPVCYGVPSSFSIECRPGRLPSCVTEMIRLGVTECLFVLRPNLKRQLQVIQITVVNPPACAK
jgi:hypothetical protein